MLTDIAIVLGFAAVAVAIVFFLFNSVSDVPKAKMDASQVLAKAAVPAKAKPAPKKTKKDAAAEKAKEQELEELIAREAAGKNKGMATERYEVTTLESAKQKAAKLKKEKSAPAIIEKKAAASEEQKAKDRSLGFKFVDAKEDKKETPVAASVAGAGKGHSGTRRASPSSPAATKRDELEHKLSQFFKGNTRRRRGDDDYEPKQAGATANAGAERVRAPRQSGQGASPASANAWAEEREW